MMNNMFFIFDPNTSMNFQMNWFSSIFNIFILPLNFWYYNSRMNKLMNLIILILYNEIKMILKIYFNYINALFFFSMFLFIFMNNFMGLFPYIFTSSSHLMFSLGFSLPLWISLMIFSYMNYANASFAHMIPLGTPLILMPFMVLIESISNIIRPLTLSIRLTANMIAGHLLVTLLSQAALNSMLISMSIIMTQTILLILEFSVSIIQAYVFMMLMVLYLKESSNINYE